MNEIELFDMLKKEKKINVQLIEGFQSYYGETFFKALEYIQIDEKKIKKNVFQPSNLIVWTIQGMDKTYRIYPGIYCQCQAFLLESIYRSKRFIMCKHLLAQKISEILNLFEMNMFSDIEYKKFIKN